MYNIHDIVDWYRHKMNTKPPMRQTPLAQYCRWNGYGPQEFTANTQQGVFCAERAKAIVDAINSKKQVVADMEEQIRAEEEEEEEEEEAEALVKGGGPGSKKESLLLLLPPRPTRQDRTR